MKKITEVRKYGVEWGRLKSEEIRLKSLLESKRYKATDLVVDTIYKFYLPKIIKRNKQNSSTPQQSKQKRLKKIPIDKGRIDIINVNFYDWNGKVLYRGGAERYVYDLACLLKKMGYRPRLLQHANRKFQKIYRGIPVIGVESIDNNIRAMSLAYKEICRDAELIIASPDELACELTDLPVITINHGISFDHYNNRYKNTIGETYLEHMEAIANSLRCVCVDTNYINWLRTKDNILSLKATYIPNYYDPQIFKLSKKKDRKKMVFVFPRRIYPARGSDITIQAFDRLLNQYQDKIELRLVGQIHNGATRRMVENILKKYPNNVTHCIYDMEEMPKAYEEADVVLIPTRCSEGTSLSCIEGMASGAAIIASNIGGLTNLIIDHYNGLLISPTSQDLEQAVKQLIKHPNLVKKIQKNAVSVAQESFTKTLWQKRWKNILKETLEAK